MPVRRDGLPHRRKLRWQTEKLFTSSMPLMFSKAKSSSSRTTTTRALPRVDVGIVAIETQCFETVREELATIRSRMWSYAVIDGVQGARSVQRWPLTE